MTPNRSAIIHLAEGGRIEYFQTQAAWGQRAMSLQRLVCGHDAVEEFFSHARPQYSRPPKPREMFEAFSKGRPVPAYVLTPRRTLAWVKPGDFIGHGYINGRSLVAMGVERWAKHELAGVGRIIVWDRHRARWREFDVEADGYEELAACIKQIVW